MLIYKQNCMVTKQWFRNISSRLELWHQFLDHVALQGCLKRILQFSLEVEYHILGKVKMFYYNSCHFVSFFPGYLLIIFDKALKLDVLSM